MWFINGLYKKTPWFLLCWILLRSDLAWAAGGADADLVLETFVALSLIFVAAKLGGFLMHVLHQPAVLGELLAGVLLGNVVLFGYEGFEFIKTSEVFHVLAEIGVVLLLFEVGLESSLEDLMKVGLDALLVALVGVVAPFVLGWLTSYYLLPDETHYVHIFVGATLCATSVGITARVLKDLGKINILESKIILGAAVIDDVLGLLILAIVTGLIKTASQSAGGEVDFIQIGQIALKAFGFLVGALVIGTKLAPHLFRYAAYIKLEGMLMTVCLAVCFLMASLAGIAGLAPIVGAFAAGLIIDGTGFARFFDQGEKSIEHFLLYLSRFFVPIFFVTMGMKVDLMTFTDLKVLFLAGMLTLMAMIGKQVCGLVVTVRPVNRMAIGIGMIPRGEVGLIFAAIGSTLFIEGHRVIDATLYSAIIVMVAITTMATPPALKWSLSKN